MLQRLVMWTLLAVVFATTVLADEFSAIVGARLDLSDGCRLGQLPELSAFVTETAPSFEALRVMDDAANEPRLVFLNRFQQQLDAVSVAALSQDEIVDALAARGVFLWSASPDYAPAPIEPSEECVAWRQTTNCSSSSPREPLMDEHCSIRIAHDRSGFCECADGLSVEVDCDHDEGSCDQMCVYARTSGGSKW